LSKEASVALDAAVLARFRDGDVAALGTVFELYGPRVHRLARAIMGNPADAEDATQEIFVRAFERARQFDGRSGLFTWLYRLAVRHCLNKLRVQQRRRTHEQSLAWGRPHQDAQDDGSPLHGMIRAEQALTADRALQALPAPYRVCLVLRELEGLTYAEIAGVLHIPLGTVMSRLARARHLLISRVSGAGREIMPSGNIQRPTGVRQNNGAERP
jgi:RNA polymerase sigma-70 factor (ECF subfamily)